MIKEFYSGSFYRENELLVVNFLCWVERGYIRPAIERGWNVGRHDFVEFHIIYFFALFGAATYIQQLYILMKNDDSINI